MGIHYIENPAIIRRAKSAEWIDRQKAEAACAFHRGIAGYKATPLQSLPALARRLGITQMLVKDESQRFGLNAFKALGGSYAIAAYLCEKYGLALDADAFDRLCAPAMREKIKEITFVTATDGNHGRGVAWTAASLGCRAVVYLPAGSAQERLYNIQKTGADARILPCGYDDTVRYAQTMAGQQGWVLVQDTAWPGYEKIPGDIMHGYTTLAGEIVRQLPQYGGQKPTHLLLQAGVGSMAGALAGYFSQLWQEECPRIIVVEPESADCLYRTAQADDGRLHAVRGEMDSMMAGLCCGEPCTLAWDILKETANGFLSCDDSYAALGMRVLGRPLATDPPIVSGESGAVTAGVVIGILARAELAQLRERLGFDAQSRVLIVSTEGDTDQENYRKIVKAAGAEELLLCACRL